MGKLFMVLTFVVPHPETMQLVLSGTVINGKASFTGRMVVEKIKGDFRVTTATSYS